MGADRSRRRPRTQALAACLVVVLAVGVSPATLIAAAKTPDAATHKKKPKPGSSCAHPLISSQTSYGPGGDAADFTVELVGFNANAMPGDSQTVHAVVTLHSSRVAICPKVLIGDEPHGPASRRYYYVSVGPEGGATSTITIPNGVIYPVAYARLKP
jgi:hypothetical protein